jgi:hypothetical protein
MRGEPAAGRMAAGADPPVGPLPCDGSIERAYDHAVNGLCDHRGGTEQKPAPGLTGSGERAMNADAAGVV